MNESCSHTLGCKRCVHTVSDLFFFFSFSMVLGVTGSYIQGLAQNRQTEYYLAPATALFEAWLLMFIISALGKRRQEDCCEFQPRQNCIYIYNEVLHQTHTQNNNKQDQCCHRVALTNTRLALHSQFSYHGQQGAGWQGWRRCTCKRFHPQMRAIWAFSPSISDQHPCSTQRGHLLFLP